MILLPPSACLRRALFFFQWLCLLWNFASKGFALVCMVLLQTQECFKLDMLYCIWIYTPSTHILFCKHYNLTWYLYYAFSHHCAIHLACNTWSFVFWLCCSTMIFFGFTLLICYFISKCWTRFFFGPCRILLYSKFLLFFIEP